MRLINIYTLELEEFFTAEIPYYYILSHRWGPDEVSYKEYVKKKKTDSPGYRKIIDACDFARTWQSSQEIRLEVRYLWIDTCCIDKRSSAELSEAINSMFKWYQKARVCFVYLADVPGKEGATGARQLAFERSDWFTRGWTLQELLAPFKVVFCDAMWHSLGWISKSSRDGAEHRGDRQSFDLFDIVVKRTGIPMLILMTPFVPVRSESSIAQRMSWAARRTTTRIEDEAYCLLGIFDINMPLLYGEGSKAFRRLQEEILRKSQDQSILAWGISVDTSAERVAFDPKSELMRMDTGGWTLLAPSPRWFNDCGNIVFKAASKAKPSQPIHMTAEGVETKAVLRLVDSRALRRGRYESALRTFTVQALELNCKCAPMTEFTYEALPYLALLLVPRNRDSEQDPKERQYYGRLDSTSLPSVDDLFEGNTMSSVPSVRARIVVPQETSSQAYWEYYLSFIQD